MNLIIQEYYTKSIDYESYKENIAHHVANGTTSGDDQSEYLIEYTKLNWSRLQRIEKTFKPVQIAHESISKIHDETLILVLTETWCGDAAQIIPAIQQMVLFNPTIEIRYLFRDKNPELMDQFLTGTSRSIPIFIVIDRESMRVLGHWGPRPVDAQSVVNGYIDKIKHAAHETELEALKAAKSKDLHTWYAHDKTIHTQIEFSTHLSSLR